MSSSAPKALVAGAGAPAGSAVSNWLAARGYRVLAVDIGLGPSGYSDQVHLDADLVQAGEIKRVSGETKRVLGEPDILVVALPAPATLPLSAALRAATDDWLDFTQTVAETMALRRQGHVVLLLPQPPEPLTIGQTLGAKAQRAAVEALASHFSTTGVRVNAIAVSPQAVASGHREVLGAVDYLERAKTLWGEMIHPERLAA
ncbi:hypothetical protein [Caulobacter sp.]|uniref:hypothetical protein n=1 Tax=Caulobacter sp. TaxID=78 RepID=UPI003BB17423